MFANARKQLIRINHFSRAIYSRNRNASVVRLCSCIGAQQNTTIFSEKKSIFPWTTQRNYCENRNELTESQFINICEITLHSLYECFEDIVEKHLSHLKDVDVMYEGGILKVELGPYGTYVINRQTPNKQIWLSSPISGPKRYDFFKESDENDGYWIYKHDGITLHKLLEEEITSILSNKVDFSKCSYSKV